MLYIWTRTAIQWEDDRAALSQLAPWFRPRLELWNATFDMPYHVFRRRLTEIARLNHSRVEGAVRADWKDIPEGSLVAPVDDDDWFAPELARVLESEGEPDVTGYRWTSSFFQIPFNVRQRFGFWHRRVLGRRSAKFLCTTNNYALLKSPETAAPLARHMVAKDWVKTPAAGRVKEIHRRLSAANTTLGSVTILSHRKGPLIDRVDSLRRAYTVRMFRRYKSLYRQPVATELEWCRPYLAMMADLMDELGLRDGRG